MITDSRRNQRRYQLAKTNQSFSTCIGSRIVLRAILVLVSLFLLQTTFPALAEERWAESMAQAKQAAEYRNPETKQLLEDLLRQAESLGEDDPRLTVTLRHVAAFYILETRYSDAIQLLEREQTILKKIDPHYPGLVPGMILLGKAFAVSGQSEKAEKTLHEAMRLSEKAQKFTHSDWVGDILNTLWLNCRYKKDYKMSLSYARQQLEHCRKKNNRRNLCSALYNMIWSCCYNKLYEESLTYLAMEQRECTNADRQFSRVFDNNCIRAKIYGEQGDVASGLRYLSKMCDPPRMTIDQCESMWEAVSEWPPPGQHTKYIATTASTIIVYMEKQKMMLGSDPKAYMACSKILDRLNQYTHDQPEGKG